MKATRLGVLRLLAFALNSQVIYIHSLVRSCCSLPPPHPSLPAHTHCMHYIQPSVAIISGPPYTDELAIQGVRPPSIHLHSAIPPGAYLLLLSQDAGLGTPCTCVIAAAPSFPQESRDIVVLTTSALVVAALIPLIPSYLGGYLGELLDTFYRLATIRSTHTFGRNFALGCGSWGCVGHTSSPPPPPMPSENVPTQLYPHLDVAVYYFFIQLYSLFPNNFVHSLQQKVQSQQHLHNFQEYIAVSSLQCDIDLCTLHLAPPPPGHFHGFGS